MTGRGWRDVLLDMFFPLSCVHCAEDMPPPLRGPLCGACLKELRPERAGVSSGPDGVSSLAWAYAYDGPAASLIRAFKYGNREDAGRSLADWMAGLFPGHPELRAYDAVVPVPLHSWKLRFRGFNQADVLARAVSRISGRPILNALARTRHTPPQRGRDKRRRLGRLHGAFAVPFGADLTGKRLLLIDDVATTGETLSACARTLLDYGAREVGAYVLARKM